MLNTIYATKKSQTQTFIEGKRTPLTILNVETHQVINNKTVEKDGYSSFVLGIGTASKKLNKPLTGIFAKLGIAALPRVQREVKQEDEVAEINLSEILVPGSIVSVSSVSKGKGTAGVMKRHGFAGGPRTHGQSDRGRAPGSIGRGTTPGRVIKGTKMAGHMGSDLINIKNLKVHSFDPETGKLEITGLIPGARGVLAKITVNKKA